MSSAILCILVLVAVAARTFVEVEDIEIDGVMYLTTDKQNGEIYKCDEDGEIMEDDDGEFIKAGYFKNGISFFL